MKLQDASRREMIRMAKGCAICAVIAIAGFFLLDQFNIATFGIRMVLGVLGGTVVAVFNFYLLCLMVQSAAATSDEKLRRAKVQASYNLRLLVQAGWVIAAFFLPFVNVIAAAVPLLFPTVIIQYLRSRGTLTSPSEAKVSEPAEELPEHNGPFEE